MVKINLGCGTNILDGWANHDWDVDITQPLPWSDNSVDFIFAEHVLEHINQHQAYNFLKECYRSLRPGGVLRITIPSITQVYHGWLPEYGDYTRKLGWSDGSKRASLERLFLDFGHQAAWTGDLLKVFMYMSGFEQIDRRNNGESIHPELCNVENHSSVSGPEVNLLESITLEATK